MPNKRLHPTRRNASAPNLDDGAVREALQELTGLTYRNQFQAGDREALLRCVCLCDAADMPIPNWARHALATAFNEWQQAQHTPSDQRKPKSLDDFVFGKRIGRHANPIQRKRDRHRRQVIFEAVNIAVHYGITGEQVNSFASTLLERYGKTFLEAVNATPHVIKTTYFQEKKSISDPHIRAELAVLAIPLLPSLPDRQR